MKNIFLILFFILFFKKSSLSQLVFDFKNQNEFNDSLIIRSGLNNSFNHCLHAAFTVRFILDKDKNVSHVKLSRYTPPDLVKKISTFIENSGELWKTRWASNTEIKDSLVIFQTISVLSEEGCATEKLYFEASDSTFLTYRKSGGENDFRASFFRRRDQRMILHLLDFDDNLTHYNIRQILILPPITIRAAEKF